MGGATRSEGESLGAFVRISGARDGARVVAITAASSDPVEASRYWSDSLTAAGVRDLHVPVVCTREQAHDPSVVSAVQHADALFLGGGDQVKLVTIVGGSPLGEAIREAYVRGAVVGGTSAGAAALARTTLAGNEVDEYGNLVAQYIGPGLGLLGHHALVDTHFSQRRRLYRLFAAIGEYPELMGLGLDEDTALIVQGDIGTVVGAGGMTFVDGRTIHYTNAESGMKRGEPLTLSAMRVGLVGAGHSFNLRVRELQDTVQDAAPS